ncbi:hypothetical protein F5Y12DRAFT_712801 [Xylaria sp. FL1777]|nr:hypothetical protein F5Y12DRAFT_712801 [Xylaria sp. FL1777]
MKGTVTKLVVTNPGNMDPPGWYAKGDPRAWRDHWRLSVRRLDYALGANGKNEGASCGKRLS